MLQNGLNAFECSKDPHSKSDHGFVIIYYKKTNPEQKAAITNLYLKSSRNGMIRWLIEDADETLQKMFTAL